jgi:hypothetical protein
MRPILQAAIPYVVIAVVFLYLLYGPPPPIVGNATKLATRAFFWRTACKHAALSFSCCWHFLRAAGRTR